MGQKRSHSLLETVTHTTVGFIGSYILGLLVLPLFFGSVTHTANFALVTVYTVWSLIRGYMLRRVFNWLHVEEYLK